MNDQFDLYCLQKVNDVSSRKVADDAECGCRDYLAAEGYVRSDRGRMLAVSSETEGA